MTVKEKANELISKMYNTEHCGIIHFPNNHYCDCSEINEFQARQCAIICCKEIIKALPFEFSIEEFKTIPFGNPDMRFWKNVLYELEHYEENS